MSTIRNVFRQNLLMVIFVIKDSYPMISTQRDQPRLVGAQTNRRDTVGMKTIEMFFNEVDRIIVAIDVVSENLISIRQKIDQGRIHVEDVSHFVDMMEFKIDLIFSSFSQTRLRDQSKERLFGDGNELDAFLIPGFETIPERTLTTSKYSWYETMKRGRISFDVTRSR